MVEVMTVDTTNHNSMPSEAINNLTEVRRKERMEFTMKTWGAKRQFSRRKCLSSTLEESFVETKKSQLEIMNYSSASFGRSNFIKPGTFVEFHVPLGKGLATTTSWSSCAEFCTEFQAFTRTREHSAETRPAFARGKIESMRTKAIYEVPRDARDKVGKGA